MEERDDFLNSRGTYLSVIEHAQERDDSCHKSKSHLSSGRRGAAGTKATTRAGQTSLSHWKQHRPIMVSHVWICQMSAGGRDFKICIRHRHRGNPSHSIVVGACCIVKKEGS